MKNLLSVVGKTILDGNAQVVCELQSEEEALDFLPCPFYTVAVRYSSASSQLYSFKVPTDVILEEDDYVVIRLPAGPLKTVKVSVVHDKPVNPAYELKWIIQKVRKSTEGYKIRQEGSLYVLYAYALTHEGNTACHREVFSSHSLSQTRRVLLELMK